MVLAIASVHSSALAADPPTPPSFTLKNQYNRVFNPSKLPVALPDATTLPTIEQPLGVLRVRPETMYGDLARAQAMQRGQGASNATQRTANGWRMLEYFSTGDKIQHQLKYNTTPEVMNYVIARDGKIYAGHALSDGVKAPHPTLIGGDATAIEALGAGQVKMVNGKIVAFDLMSGHFKPGDEFASQIVEAFSKLPPEAFVDGKPPTFAVRDVNFDKSPIKPPPLKPAVVEPVRVVEPVAPCRAAGAAPPQPGSQAPMAERLGITRPGGPSVRAQVGGQVGAVGLSVLATGAGKVVEHQTGSPLAGTTTSLTVGLGGAGVIAKVGGQSVGKVVAGGFVAGVAGSGVRAGVQYGGGSETQGDMAGYVAAGAIGAGFAGPIGAGGAVIAMAASDGVSAGIDYYYAKRENASLEEKRQILAVYRNFAAIQNRDISKEPLANFEAWKKMVAQPGGSERMRALLAEGSLGMANKMYEAHMGRPATAAEAKWVRDELARGAWLEHVEQQIMAKAPP